MLWDLVPLSAVSKKRTGSKEPACCGDLVADPQHGGGDVTNGAPSASWDFLTAPREKAPSAFSVQPPFSLGNAQMTSKPFFGGVALFGDQPMCSWFLLSVSLCCFLVETQPISGLLAIHNIAGKGGGAALGREDLMPS